MALKSRLNNTEFTPITSSEVSSDAQGIVGLNLHDAIKWLANNRCCEQSMEFLEILDIQGDDSLNILDIQGDKTTNSYSKSGYMTEGYAQ